MVRLRGMVEPDPDGDAEMPNYGAGFREADYARVPLRDLPFGMPGSLGDGSWGRKAKDRHNNCVSRPGYDIGHTLIWNAPRR